MDSATFRNDVGKEFCPRDALGHPENGCSWNGPSCGAGVEGGDGLCGPEYYKLFDKTVADGAGNSSSIVNRPDSRSDGDGGGGGGGSTGQFAFGAQEYSYPASPEAFNATCKLRMQAIPLFIHPNTPQLFLVMKFRMFTFCIPMMLRIQANGQVGGTSPTTRARTSLAQASAILPKKGNLA